MLQTRTCETVQVGFAALPPVVYAHVVVNSLASFAEPPFRGICSSGLLSRVYDFTGSVAGPPFLAFAAVARLRPFIIRLTMLLTPLSWHSFRWPTLTRPLTL